MDQNCLATIGTIFGLVGIPVGILFRALLKSQADQIADLKTLLDRAMSVNEGQTEVSKEVLSKTTRRRS